MNCSLTLAGTARELGISTATVRNWARLGKLSCQKEGNRYVFSSEEVNKLKAALQSEDNKLLRRRRNKTALGGMEGRRKADGVYYTPEKIVDQVIADLDEALTWNNLRILDPSCGRGSFLMALPKCVEPEQIYGCDIDLEAVRDLRKDMLAKYPGTSEEFWEEHIRCANYLTMTPGEDTSVEYSRDPWKEAFSLIVGNPPWGAEISSEDREYYHRMYNCHGRRRLESCDLFLEQSLRWIQPEGTIAFILPEAVLSVGAHRKIREILMNNTAIERISYLGEAFRGVQCPSIYLRLRSGETGMRAKGILVDLEDRSFRIKEARKLDSDSLELSLSDPEYRMCRKIAEGGPRIFLKDHAVFALGIVTGDNAHLLVEREKSDISQDQKDEGVSESRKWESVIRGSEVLPYEISRPAKMIRYEPDRLQQHAPEWMYRIAPKLIYRFVASHPICAMDENGRMTLNSCNIVIPDRNLGTMEYVMAVLNSSVAEFWWKKKLRTMKILRHHLEDFPFPLVDKETEHRITEMVRKCMNEEDPDECMRIRKDIENNIVELYRLSPEEREMLGEDRRGK